MRHFSMFDNPGRDSNSSASRSSTKKKKKKKKRRRREFLQRAGPCDTPCPGIRTGFAVTQGSGIIAETSLACSEEASFGGGMIDPLCLSEMVVEECGLGHFLEEWRPHRGAAAGGGGGGAELC
jgi:hypothetical protein